MVKTRVRAKAVWLQYNAETTVTLGRFVPGWSSSSQNLPFHLCTNFVSCYPGV